MSPAFFFYLPLPRKAPQTRGIVANRFGSVEKGRPPLWATCSANTCRNEDKASSAFWVLARRGQFRLTHRHLGNPSAPCSASVSPCSRRGSQWFPTSFAQMQKVAIILLILCVLITSVCVRTLMCICGDVSFPTSSVRAHFPPTGILSNMADVLPQTHTYLENVSSAVCRPVFAVYMHEPFFPETLCLLDLSMLCVSPLWLQEL